MEGTVEFKNKEDWAVVGPILSAIVQLYILPAGKSVIPVEAEGILWSSLFHLSLFHCI